MPQRDDSDHCVTPTGAKLACTFSLDLLTATELQLDRHTHPTAVSVPVQLLFSGCLLRAAEQSCTQVRDARHHAAPSKRIRLRVESGRASLPEAFGCIARQGPMLRIDSHRRTVNLTTRPTRCAWMRLPAQEVRALFDSWLRAARVKL